MRIIELKIGTTMKKVKRWVNASDTEKGECSSHSTGLSTTCARMSASFTSPLRPSSGIHEVGRLQHHLTIDGRSWDPVCNARASGAAPDRRGPIDC